MDTTPSLHWSETDKEPWAAAPTDAEMHAADQAAYEAQWGHVERRHRQTEDAHHILKIVTAVLGGLIMALGFHPFLVLIASIFIWRGLEDTVNRQQDLDRSRREAYGLD